MVIHRGELQCLCATNAEGRDIVDNICYITLTETVGLRKHVRVHGLTAAPGLDGSTKSADIDKLESKDLVGRFGA